jgi:hypothetical protein
MGESFCMETVFSDPAGDKLAFLRETMAAGYRVVGRAALAAYSGAPEEETVFSVRACGTAASLSPVA